MFRHLLVVKALLLEVYWFVQVLGSLEETLILQWRWFSVFGAARFIQVSAFFQTPGGRWDIEAGCLRLINDFWVAFGVLDGYVFLYLMVGGAVVQ